MRAVVLNEARPALVRAEVADPEPASGEVLVRVTGCGICGSDLHLAAHLAPPGTILGHEIAGVVEALGPGVEAPAARVGEAVAVRPFAGCGRCDACARGRADRCDAFAFMGMARPGGFAELTAVQACELYRLPATVTGHEQALVEPLAVARRAVRRSGVVPGDSVTIVGGGPIGQAILAWLGYLGIDAVTLSDPVADRRELAVALGASATFDPTDELAVLEAVLVGADVVFECVGRPGLIAQAMDLAGVEGRVVVVGVCAVEDTIVPYTGLRKELDVRFALYYEPRDFTETIDALASGGLPPDGFVAGTVSLEDLPDAFARLEAGATGGKLIVRP